MTPHDPDKPDELHTATDPTTGDTSASEGPRQKASERQIEANQRNAQRSTGPRTEEGKARSSRNAVLHGVYGGPVAVPRGRFREDPDEVDAATAEIVATLKPNNPMALGAAHEVAAIRLRMSRLERLEAERMAGASRREDPDGDEERCSYLERMVALIDAGLDRLSLEEWRALTDLLVIENIGDVADEITNLIDPDADGDTLAFDDPAWEYIGRDLLDEYYDAPSDLADELRARAAAGRAASAEADDIAVERAAVSLIDDGPLEKCSLIRARLGRELDRALARFHAMQALPS